MNTRHRQVIGGLATVAGIAGGLHTYNLLDGRSVPIVVDGQCDIDPKTKNLLELRILLPQDTIRLYLNQSAQQTDQHFSFDSVVRYTARGREDVTLPFANVASENYSPGLTRSQLRYFQRVDSLASAMVPVCRE